MAAEPELLDIAQAAALLRVSEASLRRWTNAGVLPCFRIGGRRERRFRRADLLAFLEQNPIAAAAGPRATGHDVATGHLCGLYTSDLARTLLAARFLANGLRARSVCFLATEPDVRAGVLGWLERQRPSLRRDIAAGQLVLVETRDSTAAQFKFWETHLAAMQDGARALCAVGDVSGGRFVRRGTFDEVLEFEAALDRFLRHARVPALCLYDARAHSGLETARVLAVHPDQFRHPVTHLVS